MIESNCSISLYNASIIQSKVIKGNILHVRRLEHIFDYFAEEPVSMFVKENESSESECFTCILRIRVWRQKHKNISWSIYSKDTKTYGSFIVRKVIWDLDKDTRRLQENVRKNQAEVSELWPSLEISNTYIPPMQGKKMIRLLKNLDSEIKNGFILHKKNNPVWEWRDLELFRLYDWGEIHYTWCPLKKNKRVQKSIKKLVLGLDCVIEKVGRDIFEMILNYSKDLEEYKK